MCSLVRAKGVHVVGAVGQQVGQAQHPSFAYSIAFPCATPLQ